MIIPSIERLRGAVVTSDGQPSDDVITEAVSGCLAARLGTLAIVPAGRDATEAVDTAIACAGVHPAHHVSTWALLGANYEADPTVEMLTSVLDAGCEVVGVSCRVARDVLGVAGIPDDDDEEEEEEGEGEKEEKRARPESCPFPRERLALIVGSLSEVNELGDQVLGNFHAVVATSKGARVGRVSEALAERLRNVPSNDRTSKGIRLVLHATSVEEAAEVAEPYSKLGVDIMINAAAAKGDAAMRASIARALGGAFFRTLRSDRPDGLVPTVVCDPHDRSLGLVYTSEESLAEALASGAGVYHSRSRGGLWRKGETSGETQRLLRIDTDCDSDALRFRVAPSGASTGSFCHREGCESCFGPRGETHGVARLFETVAARKKSAPEGSYTAKLFADRAMLNSKVIEEAHELVEDGQTPGHVAFEAADLLYFAAAVCAREGVTLEDVEASLARKARKVTRRPGAVKPEYAKKK